MPDCGPIWLYFNTALVLLGEVIYYLVENQSIQDFHVLGSRGKTVWMFESPGVNYSMPREVV